MSALDFSFECRLTQGDFHLDVAASGQGSLGLFGPSGAGKSSLLKALCGLQGADHLRLSVDGDVLVDLTAGMAPPPHRRGVGLVFQEHRLFPHRSVEANLRYGRVKQGARAPRFEEIVELLGLRGLLKSRPSECSGGERQRIAIGRALLAAPRLLLLDEPLASLDRALRARVLPYLQAARDELDVPFIFVSHDLGDLLAVTNRVALIDGGRLAGVGTLVELVQDAARLDLLHDCGLVYGLAGVVESVDETGLVRVMPEGSERSIACGGRQSAGTPVAAGASVEVRLRPEDIILALPPCAAELSLSNRFDGVVQHMTVGAPSTGGRVLVTLDCGLGRPLLAEITQRSSARLALRPGSAVVAMVKAQALSVSAGRAAPLGPA